MNRRCRVTFGPAAFLLGALVTVLLFGVPLGASGYVLGTASLPGHNNSRSPTQPDLPTADEGLNPALAPENPSGFFH